MTLEIWQAIVLGLVEGITEYLPVSSTGHLILAAGFMGLDRPESKQAIDDFSIVIQGGAILAVVGLYWPSVLLILKGLLGKDRKGLRLFANLTIAFIPSAAAGLALGDWIDEHLFQMWPVLLALVAGAFYMIAVDMYSSGRLMGPRPAVVEKSIHDVTALQALAIGVLQCAALWPGTSRSMMTITGGVLVGLRPKQAAEFSFLLGLPTLSAAMVYKLGKNLWHAHKEGTPNLFDQLGWTACIVGIVVATVSAALAVRWLVGFLNRHGLSPFGWYRLALCAVLMVLLKAGVIAPASAPAPEVKSPGTVQRLEWKGEGPGGER